MRLIPRDEGFFDQFAQLAQRLTTSARLLNQLFAEPQKLTEHVTAIKQVEHEADRLTYEIVTRIDKSFVTPIDREDIHLLASRLDNVIDLVDGTARRVAMYRITEVREPAKRLSGVLVRAAAAIEGAVVEMKRREVVGRQSQAIKQLEEEGDAIYQEAVGSLFGASLPPEEIIRWKDVYDTLETALDETEDVGNVLESIALKNS